MKIPSCNMEIEQVFLQLEQQECRSLCITSTNSGEGVTSLAQALTERHLLAGYRTLLVDLNLLNPSLTALSFIPESTLNPTSTPHYLALTVQDNVVLSGLPTPTDKADIMELRQPKNLKKQIVQWLTEFDKVIIDSSSLSQLHAESIPAQTIAGSCDGTIVVVLSGQTLKAEFQAAIELLEKNKANITGYVLNDKYNLSLKKELCSKIERLHFLPKRLSTKLISMIQRNRFLSTVV